MPLRQDIAVTGSVNQRGEVQAIGGVNEKIEGFFRVCRLAGLTGDQGVLIPEANVQHLMLSHEVVDAVADGRFHVWSARIDRRGDRPAQRDRRRASVGGRGRSPPDTMHALVADRLERWAPDEDEMESGPEPSGPSKGGTGAH